MQTLTHLGLFSITRQIASSRSRFLHSTSLLLGTSRKTGLNPNRRPLPTPAFLEQPKKEDDPDHPLWGFFWDKKALISPQGLDQCGRPWTAAELREKSFQDLHNLWYICLKELNRISSQFHERKRIAIVVGEEHLRSRKSKVKCTMQRIKHVLTERHNAWREARHLRKEKLWEGDSRIKHRSQDIDRGPNLEEQDKEMRLLDKVEELNNSGMKDRA
ncbi:54S ribosomal protein L4, mitochondrial [Neolecta irregularis DAH-3]|uniref:Large ribosomal subunit protein uL29m n=1 Tax=Neolecta irregularis (strain DAH-3) TaxID=1198029 RepID=A0A1U7LGR9_NEOID|nr:54S ribosomal protein L4, mitochondrial [Neolecta irregularis DAH-3]|eukprot:OLL21721.1 54S ribosomal protein L4, mitochondrial [Neolecta irregularis DAH-3]